MSRESTGPIGECTKRGTRPNSINWSMYSFFHKLARSLPHGGYWGDWRTFHQMSLTLQILVSFRTWMMLLIIWRSLMTLGNSPSSISLPSYWLYGELVHRAMVELVHESTTSHLADSLSASDQWPPVQNMRRKRWSISECVKRVNNISVTVNTEHGSIICVAIVWLRSVEFHKINPMIGMGGAPASLLTVVKCEIWPSTILI